MGQVKQLDQRINEAGFLRLMPVEPYAMNLSNTLRGIQGKANIKAQSSQKQALLDLPLIKKPLLWLYDSIFRWYYDRQ